MSLAYTVVDAFTSTPFHGNPACVIVLCRPLSTEQMQLIAREFSLPETAFLEAKGGDPKESGMRRYGLRWFTPTMEFLICGHATLASAHALFTSLGPDVETLRFDTMSGELVASRLADGKLEISLPSGLLSTPSEDVVEKTKRAITQATGAKLDFLFFGVGSGVSYGAYLVVEVGKVDLKGLIVNPGRLVDLTPAYTTVILTCRGGGDVDFISRAFAPDEGIPEDPVTGSAHCLLAPYWKDKLRKAKGEELRAAQVSPRGGAMIVVWDEEAGRCRLRGEAVTVLRGELLHLPSA